MLCNYRRAPPWRENLRTAAFANGNNRRAGLSHASADHELENSRRGRGEHMGCSRNLILKFTAETRIARPRAVFVDALRAVHLVPCGHGWVHRESDVLARINRFLMDQ